jgi:hypothetical protein
MGIVKAFLYFSEIGPIILEVECDASDICREQAQMRFH